jgi:ABC-2 type transport system ATP-binding protein
VINKGRIILVEEKAALMRHLGRKQLTIQLQHAIDAVPGALAEYNLQLSPVGDALTYTYDTQSERTGIATLLQTLGEAGIRLKDLQTRQSSLEDIFVNLLKETQ